MFVRTKTSKNSPRKTVQIVSNQRVGTKVKQIIIRHVGVGSDEQEIQQLKLLAQKIIIHRRSLL